MARGPEPTARTIGAPRPGRSTSPTNLTRDEARWRARLVTLSALDVTIDLTGAPDRGEEGFSVRSALALELAAPASGLWVDFVGLGVSAVLVDGAAAPVRWDGARIELPALTAGDHAVVVHARGRFSNSGQGLHRFHDPVDGATYLYTHFEPSDARRAWPCLEQPDLKAPFTLTAVHPAAWSVLGNGSVAAVGARPGAGGGEPGEALEPGAPGETRLDGELLAHAEGASVTRFAPTAPLPSYLTAVAAGPWHTVSSQWRSSLRPEDPAVPISWSCRASLAEHLDAEPLELTVAGLDLYDRSYGFPYPWGSYDCVLVPEYNLGAMENPGCVTFNEEAYLFQGPVTRAQRAGRANTILHEMCHMWFGDLVTPRWWEDTWLKESFAENQGTWAQTEATAYDEAWVSFASTRKAWAYREDSRAATTHPVVATVDDVETARQTFDGITYAKGAAVLKQLVAHVGQDVFLRAARAWFTEHAFANGDLAEFLGTLSAASGRDMGAWADAWLRTSGPSVLTDEIETDGERITRLVVRQSATDPTTGEEVLRPHTLVVGLYAFDQAGDLVRTSAHPVALDGSAVEVPGAVGLPVPDLVTVNDEDLTYAIVRPDPASLATARQALGRLADPMARALWWSALHNLARDGLLAPEAFVATVLDQAGDDIDASTLATLLSQAHELATRATRASRRAAVIGRLTGAAAPPDAGPSGWDLLEAAPQGSDAQLVRARAWATAAGSSALAGDDAVARADARLRAVLGGGLPGLVLDADLRWRLLIALARLGRVSREELDAQSAADPSASGRTRRAQADASVPSPEVKERVIARVLKDDSLSNDELDALLAGYGVDAHRELTAPWTGHYLGSLEETWSRRGQEIATRLVLGLFPAAGDASDLGAVDAWLAGHANAPQALRRLVLKSRDDLARALRSREL